MSLRNGRKRIVILGGGCGGVVAATHLGRKLGADHDVILIDRRADHIFMPAFLFVMLGERQPWDISRSLSHLQKRNVKVIQSEIRGIDPIRQEVSLEKEKVSYDYLIVSLRIADKAGSCAGICRSITPSLGDGLGCAPARYVSELSRWPGCGRGSFGAVSVPASALRSAVDAGWLFPSTGHS